MTPHSAGAPVVSSEKGLSAIILVISGRELGENCIAYAVIGVVMVPNSGHTGSPRPDWGY